MIFEIQHESYVFQCCFFVLMAEFEEFVDHDLSNEMRRNLKFTSPYCREGDRLQLLVMNSLESVGQKLSQYLQDKTHPCV